MSRMPISASVALAMAALLLSSGAGWCADTGAPGTLSEERQKLAEYREWASREVQQLDEKHRRERLELTADLKQMQMAARDKKRQFEDRTRREKDELRARLREREAEVRASLQQGKRRGAASAGA